MRRNLKRLLALAMVLALILSGLCVQQVPGAGAGKYRS